jgi:formyl-CoA transferase
MAGISSGLLTGMRIIEVGQLVAGPYAACLLAELGADVIKVEAPGRGDASRGILFEGRPYLWWIENRNKRCITLDLKSEQGQSLFLRLLGSCDALIENSRPGTFDSWGLTEDRLREASSSLVITHISGYGQSGPYRDRPSTDRQALAMSGITYLTGYPDSAPVRPGVPVSDYVAGAHAALATMAALFARRVNSAPAETIDISLLDGMLRMTQGLVQEYLDTGEVRTRTGNRNSSVPGDTFLSQDRVWLMISAGTDRNWQQLARAMGREDYLDDHELVLNEGRRLREDELLDAIRTWAAQHPAAWLEKALADYGVPCSRVFTAADLADDPQMAHRNSFVAVPADSGDPVVMPAPVGRFAHAQPAITHAGPGLGEHTCEVLEELLGLSKTEVAALAAQRVV